MSRGARTLQANGDEVPPLRGGRDALVDEVVIAPGVRTVYPDIAARRAGPNLEHAVLEIDIEMCGRTLRIRNAVPEGPPGGDRPGDPLGRRLADALDRGRCPYPGHRGR